MQPASSPRAPSSLARSTLIKMGVRIAVVIALTTLFSYLHILTSFRSEALLQIERSAAGRSQREEAIFVLAEDNHAVLKKEVEEHFRAWSQRDPTERFEAWFAHLPDGSIRNNPRGFDGTKMPGVIVPKGVKDDIDFRRRLVASYEVISQYGPAFHVRFMNTGVMLPEGALVGYWPEGATWFQDVEATFSVAPLEYFTISTPENNPRRESAWTGIYEDTTSQTWLVTVATPLDMDGRHVATVSHDVLLDDLMRRTRENTIPGTYNILFRGDGQLIAHPELRVKSGAGTYNIVEAATNPDEAAAQVGTPAQRTHLRDIFERVKAAPLDQPVLELSEHGEYLAVAHLEGPDWIFVTVLPEQVVSSAAFEAARYVLAFGVASLLLELAIMYWVLRQQITRPLLSFTQATAQVAAGDFKVGLDTRRGDELGQLARSFQLMAGEVQRREEALRQANEGLEQRVEERTQELQQVHKQLLETARQVGRAEIATNVLHNVGNVLNSVHTSAQIAAERLAALKIDSVERVASLFDEHQGDLVTFLTQDERGRKSLSFLSRLAKFMQVERQEIQILLGDVGRHTEHIGAIVKLQQQYARVPQRLVEPVLLSELVEDALRINQAALGRHSVKVARDLVNVPPVLTEKHKVLMILVNLISNAKYAMDSVSEDERLLTVALTPTGDDRIRIEVRDNGMGIAPEMLTRIFQYGFTTRQEGHGFGLHSSALAAQELGGSLLAHSDGPGKGATFTLELPSAPEHRSEQANA
ncbi:ATP-binding protein [Hyalangium rubrum]|uniref:histidine kinase n=1 Tax=Hyalangium rubrum TaxID=3103134 RepID=A0ABU5H5C3_9BACT|nr:ATP-binding protein [Hyalangium sp. s54d21]MDY7228696.1 ATP-binding protein [Hyalangium sp. s54d21]